MQRFESHYARVNRMCKNLAQCANRALLHELYPYFWDLNHLLSIIRSYLKWLMTATQDDSASVATDNSGNLENVVSGNNSSQWPSQTARNEPWYNRGGLFGEFQRLLPLDVRSSDLFSCAPADPRTEKIYSIRPYFESTDRVAIFELCAASLSARDAAAQLVVNLNAPIDDTNTTDAAMYNRSMGSTSVFPALTTMLPSTLNTKWYCQRSRSPSSPSSSSPPTSTMSVGEALVSNSVIGAYLNMSPSRLICFVNCSEQSVPFAAASNESNEMICGYVMAAPEARAFRVNARPWFQITASRYTRALQGVPVDLSAKGN